MTVRLAEPQFEGQTKEVLGTSAASRIVAGVVGKELTAVLTARKPAAKAQARTILDKVAGAMRTRVEMRQHKEHQRRKNALESSSMPAKLKDCRSEDVERCELFIVEGDSALGTAKAARDSEFQALLPIRGKILNVQKATASDLLKNIECASIIQVIGAGSGRTFDLDAARYSKIILMADADVDGAHIRTLLLTLVLQDDAPSASTPAGSTPPSLRCTASRSSTPAPRPTTTSTPTQTPSCPGCSPTSTSAGGRTSRRRSATRASARWTPSSWPRRRWTRVDVPCGASPSATPRTPKPVFELLMGNDVAPRRDFIVDGAAGLDRDRIDA